MFLDVDDVLNSVYEDAGKTLELYGFDPRSVDCVDFEHLLRDIGLKRNGNVDCSWVEVFRGDNYSGDVECVKGYGKLSEIVTNLSLKVEGWISDQNPEFRDGLVIFPKDGYERIKNLNEVEIYMLLWRDVKHVEINEPDCLISICAEPLLKLPRDYESQYYIVKSMVNRIDDAKRENTIHPAFRPVSLMEVETMVMVGAEAPESLKINKPVGVVNDDVAFGFVTDRVEMVYFRPEEFPDHVLKKHGDWKAAYMIPAKNGSGHSSIIFCHPQHPEAINVVKRYDILKNG